MTVLTKSERLVRDANAAYDDENREWFYAQETEDLVYLWSICCDINQGAAWDDEVYDALAERGHFKNEGNA